MPADPRNYVSGNYYLNLDGVKCGFLQSVDGGAVSADVVSEPVGPDFYVRKHLGPPRYEEFILQFGLSLAQPLYDWIAAACTNQYQRRNGTIITTDQRLEARSQREFYNALISEITFPDIDASSRQPGYLTLKFAPEYTRYSKASGKVDGPARPAPKAWLPANFRLEIAGLDCTKVNKIDTFTIKQSTTSDDIGDARDKLREPGKLEFPNLRITLAEVAAQSWIDWHEDFVIKGNNDSTKERTGSLILLSPNVQQELARINFYNLGIFRLAPTRSEANADQIKRVTAELYCERMEFQMKGQGARPTALPTKIAASRGAKAAKSTMASDGAATPRASKNLLQAKPNRRRRVHV
jgi:phage tail-like protein